MLKRIPFYACFNHIVDVNKKGGWSSSNGGDTMRKKIMKYLENSIGEGYGDKAHRKSQHKRFRGRITRQLIAEGLEDVERDVDVDKTIEK